MGHGDQNKILRLLGLVMLSRWWRLCKGSFPPSPPIHLSFLSFSPFFSLLEEARLSPALEILGPPA